MKHPCEIESDEDLSGRAIDVAARECKCRTFYSIEQIEEHAAWHWAKYGDEGHPNCNGGYRCKTCGIAACFASKESRFLDPNDPTTEL